MQSQENDWRSQYVKWNAGINYELAIGSNDAKKSFLNTFNVIISTDVALSENDVFDSADLYLQPFIEVSIPTEMNKYNNLSFQSFSGGVNLKKYMILDNYKQNFYFLAGGKTTFVLWQLNDDNRNSKYHIIKQDFIINAGMGYTINNFLEAYGMYNYGFKRSYASADLENMIRRSSFAIGLKITLFNDNWWFKKR